MFFWMKLCFLPNLCFADIIFRSNSENALIMSETFQQISINFFYTFFFFQDEVLAISDKVVIRANDLLTWLDYRIKWNWGLQASVSKKYCEPIKSVSLKNTQIDFTEVDQEKGEYLFRI